MNSPRFSVLLVATLSIAALAGCSKSDEEAAPGSEAEAEQPSRVKQGANGEVVVVLDADTQKIMGLQTATLAAAKLSAEIKCYGRVVDPTMLSAAVAESISARASVDASQKELERLKSLAAQDNASVRALESAEATAKRDTAQAASARAHLLAATGKAIADRADLPAFVQSLASGESALVRMDLPAGKDLQSDPAGARIVALGDGQNPIEAKFLGQTASVDPQTQNQGFLFLVEANSGRLSPGVAVTGYLSVTGESQAGVIVPRAAVIRHAGATYVYLETDGTNFVRRAISLGQPLESGWFVAAGVKAGDQVVVTGAQTVFSEELNSSGFMSGGRD